ncbi:PKD domain containing protein [Candidatus Magnetomorum sp. HK-1]|nr:PKD domain containing protein [Candidatus Magnetomorum sp. HK-1]
MKNIIALIMIMLTILFFLSENVFSESIYEIPIEYNSWYKMFCGSIEKTDSGLKIYGTSYRWGNNLVSKDLFNFSDSEVYIKWLANGNNRYGAFGVSIVGVEGVRFTTDHSYNGSKIIQPNLWYYTRIKINEDYSFEIVTSTDDYDVNDGTFFDTKSGSIEYSKHEIVSRSTISLYFADVYSGNNAYMMISEVKTNAEKIPLKNIYKKIYDFENTSAIPSEFNFSDNWIIDNTGHHSSKSLFIETAQNSSITMTVKNAIGISFTFKETNDSTSHGSYKFYFKINGKNMSSGFNGDHEICWNERFFPLYGENNTLEWNILHPNSAWIDNITVYQSYKDEISFQTGYNIGFQAAYQVGKMECIDNPSSCGIKVYTDCSQEEIDEAITEATINLVKLDGTKVLDGTKLLFTENELSKAVSDALSGTYSKNNVDDIVEHILEWGDADGNGKIGLKEAINALIISTGINPD